MTPKSKPEEPAAINIRGIPREFFYKLKLAAVVERKSIKDFVLELIETKVQDLERKGQLPKGQG